MTRADALERLRASVETKLTIIQQFTPRRTEAMNGPMIIVTMYIASTPDNELKSRESCRRSTKPQVVATG
jgi:hypothetical protein